jgi:uncharacterized membrane protein YoaK (UPF0700 family)
MDQRLSRPAAVSEPSGADHALGGFVLAFALLALAGWVDALGLVQWHGLYVSAMSGNSTVLGGSPAVGDWHGGLEAGRAILFFLVGIVTGELLGGAVGVWRSPVVVGTEAALLWLALVSNLSGWGGLAVPVAVTGLAMGIQTAAIHKIGGQRVALTYVTGTLVSLGRGIAAGLRGDEPWHKALFFAGCWLALVFGAAGGGLVARIATAEALGVAAAAASIAAILSAIVIMVRAQEAKS